MRFIFSFAFFLSLASLALADIDFIVPVAGTTFKAGEDVTTVWEDSGTYPKISELTQYDLFLCAGSDTPGSYEEVATLMKDATFARGNSVSFSIDPKVGGNGLNTYFLKIVASGLDVFVINYSDRFTLTGMMGSFPPCIANWTASQHPPLNENPASVAQGVHSEGKRAVVDPYTVPYALQTGPIRYAPIAKRPGSTIATTSPVPQFTASLYTIATTYLPPATVVTTLTASETYSVDGWENTAAPAPHPYDIQKEPLLER